MTSTTRRFVHDINRLIATKKERQSELQNVTIVPIVAVRGIGEANQPPKADSTNRIASPLVEVPDRREYYPPTINKK